MPGICPSDKHYLATIIHALATPKVDFSVCYYMGQPLKNVLMFRNVNWSSIRHQATSSSSYKDIVFLVIKNLHRLQNNFGLNSK